MENKLREKILGSDMLFAEKPLISIVTVVLNSKNSLEKTIKSVISQTYDNIEYIIIDGGSTDGTIEIIKKYENAIDYWISEKDEGIYDAMNKGIKVSSGRYIGIINSGDWYQLGAVRKVVDVVLSSSAVDIVFGDMFIVDEKTGSKRFLKGNIDLLHRDMSINHPTCFVKRDIYGDRGFNTKYLIAADYEFILRQKFGGKKFYYINSVLANMKRGGVSSYNPLTSKERFIIHEHFYSKSHAICLRLSVLLKDSMRNFAEKVLPRIVVDFIKGYRS